MLGNPNFQRKYISDFRTCQYFFSDFRTFFQRRDNCMYEIYSDIRNRLGYKDSDVAKGTNIPRSTFSDWKKGRSKPKQDKLIKIADFLNVSMDELLGIKRNYDVFTGKTTSNDVKRLLENSTEVIGIDSDDNVIELTKRDSREIEEILNKTKEMLSQEGLLFDGEPASEESIESILSAMEMGMALAKQKNKEKYTPNKYKKD